jgi:hypothetical protein
MTNANTNFAITLPSTSATQQSKHSNEPTLAAKFTQLKPYSLERDIFVKRCDRICFAVRQIWAEIFDSFEGDVVEGND